MITAIITKSNLRLIFGLPILFTPIWPAPFSPALICIWSRRLLTQVKLWLPIKMQRAENAPCKITLDQKVLLFKKIPFNFASLIRILLLLWGDHYRQCNFIWEQGRGNAITSVGKFRLHRSGQSIIKNCHQTFIKRCFQFADKDSWYLIAPYHSINACIGRFCGRCLKAYLLAPRLLKSPRPKHHSITRFVSPMLSRNYRGQKWVQ